jgi:hypothetical protein
MSADFFNKLSEEICTKLNAELTEISNKYVEVIRQSIESQRREDPNIKYFYNVYMGRIIEELPQDKIDAEVNRKIGRQFKLYRKVYNISEYIGQELRMNSEDRDPDVKCFDYVIGLF